MTTTDVELTARVVELTCLGISPEVDGKPTIALMKGS